jgi:chromosome segregation ATPase
VQAVEAVLAKVKSKETELEALEEAALESAADETSLRERLAALAAEKKQSEDESRHTIKVKKEEKSQLKELRNELNRTRREMTEIQEIVREAEMALEEKRSEIAHRHENAQVQDQERTLQLASEERRLQEAEQELENVEANIERLQMAQGTKETDVDDAKNEMKQAQVLVERCTTPVKSLQASSANSVAVFGHNCALVKRSVDEYIEEGRFRDNVIGPIGVHCMIYQGKERFGSLAEAAVGPGVLDGFIVFNDHDRKIVQQIRAHHNVRHTCGVFQMHHHEKYHVPNPPEGVETVASVLRVMDDDVFNCLVDFCRIEDKALCNSKTESENRLLQQQPNGGFKIAVSRIKEVLFLPNGDRWKVTGGCHLSLMSNTKELRPARLGMDTREALRDAEERMEDANASFRQKQHDFESLRAQLQSIEAELEEIKSRRRHLQNRVHNAHIRIGSLQRRRNEAMIEQDHDTSEEEAAVEHAKESWSLKDARCTSIHRRYDETMMAITEKSRDVEEEENRTKQLSQDIADTEKDMEKYVQRSDEIKFRREILADARSELQKQQDVLLDEERKGEVLCLRAKILVANHREAEARRRRRENGTSCSSEDVERVSPNDIAMPDLNGLESMSYYASRIATNQKAIKEALEEIGRGGSEGIESAYEKYLRAKNLFDTKVAKNEELKRLCKVMKEDVKNRKSRWLQFRAFISDIVSIRFGEILTLRDSFGSVLFDHDSKTLMPTFVPDSRNEINIQRDMMGLSGGERSLSTIALLLALGETAENPFRAMDEFDVFLDAVTRKIITDNLIKIGKRMSNRQFIFLTPQDISDVEADQMVKILSLSNPNRSHQGAVGAAPN